MYRKTYVQIEGETLEKNTREIISKYKDYFYYFGVVKNNAYHHGIKIVNHLIEGGVNYLAVSSLEEAIEIRKYNMDIPILVLEPIDLEYVFDAVNNKITLTIENVEYVKKLNKIELPYPVNLHLKIDTGMHRLGITSKKEANEIMKIVTKNEKLLLEGIYSHFATSGINDIYYDAQIKRFKEITSDIPLQDIPIIHLDRSLTLVTHQKLAFVNGVRLGIVLYGFNGSRPKNKGIKGKLREIKRNIYAKRHALTPSILENTLSVKTAFSLYTEVLSLREVKKGEAIGYNASYKVKENGFIATLPIGYADGVTKEFGFVSIRKKRYPIIADSMDMLMIFVDKSIKLKDKVEIFGDTIPIKEVTNRLHTNSYHLFNQISNRVPRIYKEKGNEIEIKY